MKISEVSELTGLSQDTLRYYEKLGLIEQVTRTSGIRNYDEADLERINFIICMLCTGMTLEVLKEFVDLFNQGEKTLEKRIGILEDNRIELVNKMQDLQESLEYLDNKIDYYKK